MTKTIPNRRIRDEDDVIEDVNKIENADTWSQLNDLETPDYYEIPVPKETVYNEDRFRYY